MTGETGIPTGDHHTTVVLMDANVLINLIHIGQLDLLGRLPGLRFVVPDHVMVEITEMGQAEALRLAVEAKVLEPTTITSLDEMTIYAELHRTLGQGESACLAIAIHRSHSVASDEKRAFRRAAVKKIGEARILTTERLLLLAIRAGLASIAQADQWKLVLEKQRFKMKFASFQDLL
ncbi:MAG TPA: hypothetical protein DCE18_14895 [Syntrophobacteraceae bacterium]|nr:hypothetical protein [Syntrophobacteraceae bacterium]